MEWYEIVIIVLACAFVLGVFAWRIGKAVKGKGGCDCCSDCASCRGCVSKEKKKN